MGFGEFIASVDRVVRAQLGSDNPITYTPGTGAPVAVNGVFDSSFLVVGTEIGEAGVATSGPAVFLSLSDLPSDPETDTAARVTVGGVVYVPHTVKPDGLGGVVLLMHKV